jgi:hypothetical protein
MMLGNAVTYFQILYNILEIVGMLISTRFGTSVVKHRPVQHEAGMLDNSCALLMFSHKQQPKTGVSNTTIQKTLCYKYSIYLLLHYPLHVQKSSVPKLYLILMLK